MESKEFDFKTMIDKLVQKQLQDPQKSFAVKIKGRNIEFMTLLRHIEVALSEMDITEIAVIDVSNMED